VITYGYSDDADVRATGKRRDGLRTCFTVHAEGRELGEVSIAVPGDHNIRNSLAAIAVGRELGISFDDAREAIGGFTGISRRLEVRSDADGLTVVDDYAHHPTELRATLSAAREWQPNRRLVAVFQPHRYSRTKELGPEFGPPLAIADRVIVTSIYAAGEAPIPGVTSEVVVEAARDAGAKVSLADSWEDAVDLILPETRPGDVVLTLGAGDVWKAGDRLAARWAASPAGNPRQPTSVPGGA
jgi:UDP-N-acetylmuramate--alanine ligase